MARRHQDIDRILKQWAYQPGEVCARMVRGPDGRELLQMRVEMGILQLEVDHRPDGERPEGADTYFDYLLDEALREGSDFELNADQCAAADREFLQYYHRRICWLALREFRRAVRDADHSLAFMDFVRAHSPDEEWTLSHEQYRPFVLFHRTQAATLATLEEDGPAAALRELNAGLERFRKLFAEYDAEDHYDDDELVQRLVELKQTLREQYNLLPSLPEQLAEAVASEQYELAARLRDQITAEKKRRRKV